MALGLALALAPGALAAPAPMEVPLPVAGTAALVIQAYAKAQHGSLPSPAAVKQILLSTAADLGAPATEQGTGLLNSLKAVELASRRPGDAPRWDDDALRRRAIAEQRPCSVAQQRLGTDQKRLRLPSTIGGRCRAASP